RHAWLHEWHRVWPFLPGPFWLRRLSWPLRLSQQLLWPQLLSRLWLSRLPPFLPRPFRRPPYLLLPFQPWPFLLRLFPERLFARPLSFLLLPFQPPLFRQQPSRPLLFLERPFVLPDDAALLPFFVFPHALFRARCRGLLREEGVV